jgi:hypothetical protein
MNARRSDRRLRLIRAWALGVLALAPLFATLRPAGAEDAVNPASAAVRQAFSDARRAMAERDLDAAKQHLAAAGKAAKSQTERDELARLETLLDYQRQFWELIGKGATNLQPGEELVIGKNRMAFVEAQGNDITLRIEGQNRRYSRTTMPVPLAMALAEKSLAKDATSKVIVGAFLAMDAKGDRQVARRLWQDAAKAGLDVAALVPELDGAAGGKLPVPAETKLRVAEEAVREEFRRLYERSGLTVVQEDLAKTLLARAPEVSDDPEKRYVMLRDARDMAAMAANLQMAGDAIQQMARFYDVDALAMRVEVLDKVAQKARGLDASRQVVLAALRLVDDAVAAKRADLGGQAARLAVGAARKVRNRILLQQAVAAQEKVEALSKPGGAAKP